MPRKKDTPKTTLYRCAAVRDARRVDARPAAVLVRGGRIVAAGARDAVEAKLPKRGEHDVVDLPDRLILPALVNAHAHLDLVGLKPEPYGGDFAQWIAKVTEHRLDDKVDIEADVRGALRDSWLAGVGTIGDIAFSPRSVRTWFDWPANDPIAPDGATPIEGVSYLECFGLGAKQEAAYEKLVEQLNDLPFDTPLTDTVRGTVLGISPHAPYTVGVNLYKKVVALSQARAYRLCTHMAESPAEIEFVRDGKGPLLDMRRAMGLSDDIEPTGLHPIDLLHAPIRAGRWLLVHCNLIEPGHVPLLRKADASVAYCPVASDYFGLPGDGRKHPYRDLIEGKVNVCLGTDSLRCQPADEPQPMGVLPQMRHLYRRDETDPALLLQMATTNGMRALELDEREATLTAKTPADLIAVQIDPDDETDALTQALRNDSVVERLIV